MRTVTGIGMWVGRAAVLCAAATLAVAVAAPTSASVAAPAPASASASADTWVSQPAAGPSGPPDAALTSVSCTSATSCMAVGTSDFGFDRLMINLRGPIATFAERWNGSSWSLLPTPSAGAGAGASPGLVAVSCTSASFCVAVGSTRTGGRQYLPGLSGARGARALLEIFDGTAWTVRATPLSSIRDSQLSGVSCVSARFCLAVGSSGLVWNGTSWTQVRLPPVKWDPRLTAVSCATAGDCTAVGSYNRNKVGVAYLQPLAARWRGGRWTVARPPAERDRYHGKTFANDTWLTAISCPSGSWCLATGLTLRTQNIFPQGGFADVWTGSHWSAATSGIARNSPLNGVACRGRDDCFAAGQYDPRTITAPSTQQPLISHWASGRWSRVAIPAIATLTNSVWNAGNLIDPDFFGIACVGQTGCSAVGVQPQGGGRSAPLVMSDLPTPPG